jgi:hypothetical protein
MLTSWLDGWLAGNGTVSGFLNDDNIYEGQSGIGSAR